MRAAIEKAKTEFNNTPGCSLLIMDMGGRVIHTSAENGVRPLLGALQLISGAVVADRIIGRAAAFLAVYGGAAAVYGHIMSRPAMDVLREHNIPFEYGTEVSHILNRAGTGPCPMEALVLEISSPAAAYEAILAKVRQMPG